MSEMEDQSRACVEIVIEEDMDLDMELSSGINKKKGISVSDPYVQPFIEEFNVEWDMLKVKILNLQTTDRQGKLRNSPPCRVPQLWPWKHRSGL